MARTADRPWYRKSRKCWYTTIDGQQVPLGPDKKEADKQFLALKLERATQRNSESQFQTVASVLDAYLRHAERHLSPRHYSHELAILTRFAEDHGRREVETCKPIHLTEWLDAQETWRSSWTLYRVVATVKRAFKWGAAQRLIRENPFAGVSRRPGAPRRPITDDEFQRLLRGAGGPTGKTFRQALVFMRWTGCRPGEMANLVWSDIDLERARLVITAHKTAKRTGRPRIVPLTPVVVKLLAYRRTQTEGPRVFLNAYGNAWHRSALALRLKRCRLRQNIPKDATLYGIRHSFGTQAITRGVDLKTLSQLMGHTTTRMTEHYLHLAGESEHLERSMRRATSRRPGV